MNGQYDYSLFYNEFSPVTVTKKIITIMSYDWNVDNIFIELNEVNSIKGRKYTALGTLIVLSSDSCVFYPILNNTKPTPKPLPPVSLGDCMC